MFDDKFHEECGVFGVFGRSDAAVICTLGLHSLQHRGQEAAGIVSYDGNTFHAERHVGLIGDTFSKPSVIERLPGYNAIGHNRYATTGGEGLRNVQPFYADFAGGGFTIAHNGNITNATAIRRALAAARCDLPVDVRYGGYPSPHRHERRAEGA